MFDLTTREALTIKVDIHVDLPVAASQTYARLVRRLLLSLLKVICPMQPI